jgi:DNA-directed RNA polymerase subunit RPC12/RpoP
MADNVVDFAQAKLEASPHKTGQVKCGACKHTWVCVVPAETPEGFECPSCGTMRGLWNHGFDIASGDASYRCGSCEHDGWILAVKPSGHQYIVCKSCGNIDRPPIAL